MAQRRQFEILQSLGKLKNGLSITFSDIDAKPSQEDDVILKDEEIEETAVKVHNTTNNYQINIGLADDVWELIAKGSGTFAKVLARVMARLAIKLAPHDEIYREVLIAFKEELPYVEDPVDQVFQAFDVLYESITRKNFNELSYLEDVIIE